MNSSCKFTEKCHVIPPSGLLGPSAGAPGFSSLKVALVSTKRQAGGLTAISRWLSEAIPPDACRPIVVHPAGMPAMQGQFLWCCDPFRVALFMGTGSAGTLRDPGLIARIPAGLLDVWRCVDTNAQGGRRERVLCAQRWARALYWVSSLHRIDVFSLPSRPLPGQRTIQFQLQRKTEESTDENQQSVLSQ